MLNTNADVYDCYGMGDKPQYTNQAMWYEKNKDPAQNLLAVNYWRIYKQFFSSSY